jgi:hypothetical protein
MPSLMSSVEARRPKRWASKAEAFIDPGLQAAVHGLEGEAEGDGPVLEDGVQELLGRGAQLGLGHHAVDQADLQARWAEIISPVRIISRARSLGRRCGAGERCRRSRG